jgi:hypothetical protein
MTISFRDINFLFWIPFIRTPDICINICVCVCVIAARKPSSIAHEHNYICHKRAHYRYIIILLHFTKYPNSQMRNPKYCSFEFSVINALHYINYVIGHEQASSLFILSRVELIDRIHYASLLYFHLITTVHTFDSFWITNLSLLSGSGTGL